MRRFTETDKWKDPWYRQLPYGTKLVYAFLCDTVDPVGVWKPDFGLADFVIGEKIEWDAVKKRLGDRLFVLKNGDWLLTKFVTFQYRALSWNCKAHHHLFRLLKKHLPNGYPPECAPVIHPEPEDPFAPVQAGKKQKVYRVSPKSGKAKLSEVLEFCAEAGISKEDGEWFFHKCEGAGWMNGGRPIIDWKATLRGWRAAGSILPSHKAEQKKADEEKRRQTHLANLSQRAPGHNAGVDYSKRPTKA